MFNLNSIPIPDNNPNDNANLIENDENKNFPTVGLKSILQNSDLLELLLKPMESPDNIEKEKINNNIQVDSNVNFNNNSNNETDLSTLNLDDLLKPTTKFQMDHDYFEYNATKVDRNLTSSPSKSYGNAFLGPSLWDKDDIFQGEKFGVEYLGIDEFLNDNNLNEADIKFLDRLQNNDSICEDTTKIQTSSPNTTVQIHEPKEIEPILKAPIINDPNITVKVKDDSKIVKLVQQPNKPISNLISQWKDEEDAEMNSEDEISVTTKKFFDERLTLQPTLKKSKKQFVPNELKDEKYWARRKKNNVAAKRSRDTRRFKENQIVIAATYLEHENDQLRKQLLECKEKMAQMQARLDRYEQTKSN